MVLKLVRISIDIEIFCFPHVANRPRSLKCARYIINYGSKCILRIHIMQDLMHSFLGLTSIFSENVNIVDMMRQDTPDLAQ